MNIGRLFVSLGVKGGQKSLGTISGVRKGLKDTASSGLEAKAAIIGAMYALERLTSKSGQFGTDLTNFNATLGISMKTLQQYQYAARQVGVSNEAVEGTFRGLQSVITNTLMGKGIPEGLARVSLLMSKVGVNMSPVDMNEFAKDPAKLIQILQQYAQLEQNPGLRNTVLKSFGIGEDMIAGLTRNAFTPQVMNRAPTYSDNEIKKLDEANIAWSNLGNSIEMAVGRMNAQFGPRMVKDIGEVVKSVLELTTALILLANELKAFDTLSDIFKGWAAILRGDLTKEVESGTEAKYGNKDFVNQTKFVLGALFGDEEKPAGPAAGPGTTMSEMLSNIGDKSVGQNLAAPASVPGTAVTSGPTAAAPMPPMNNISSQNNNTTINQNLNFQHEGKDAKQTGDSLKRATQNALRQMPGLAQGS